MRFGGLIAAIVLAAIAAVIVLRMSATQAPPPVQPGDAPSVRSASIYVAAQPIAIGTTISEEMVTTQPWPEHLLLDGFMKADGRTTPVGMVARAPFQTQEPLIASKVANAQDPNFLAGALPKGMRVITIQTNEIEGIAGFIFPGDRVDILLTRDVTKWVRPPASSGQANAIQTTDAITETLLTNVTVVAVDQRSTAQGATDKNGNLVTPRSVSLMVSPMDAQRLRLGVAKGTLTLVLRSLDDREAADPLIITGISDVSQYQEAEGLTGGGAGSVLIIRGVDTEEAPGRAPLASPSGQQAVPFPNGVEAPVAR